MTLIVMASEFVYTMKHDGEKSIFRNRSSRSQGIGTTWTPSQDLAPKTGYVQQGGRGWGGQDYHLRQVSHTSHFFQKLAMLPEAKSISEVSPEANNSVIFEMKNTQLNAKLCQVLLKWIVPMH